VRVGGAKKKEVHMNQTTITQIEALVASGVSLADALNQCIKAPVVVGKVDRVAWISDINNLEDLRLAIKHAYAKKSKTKDPSGKYQLEVAAGQARKNEIMALINTASDPIEEAKRWGESPDGLIQIWMDQKARDLELAFLEVKGSKKEVKLAINKQPLVLSEALELELGDLGEDVLATFKSRVARNDIRTHVIVRKVNLLESLGR
jgi:hypothetical protein